MCLFRDNAPITIRRPPFWRPLLTPGEAGSVCEKGAGVVSKSVTLPKVNVRLADLLILGLSLDVAITVRNEGVAQQHANRPSNTIYLFPTLPRRSTPSTAFKSCDSEDCFAQCRSS